MGLSVVILTFNEERNICACLQSVSWCDDVLVLDSYSTDRTEAIARAMGARFLQRPFRSFADQRNWAMANGELKHDWVLHLDADERVTPKLAQAVREAVESADGHTAGYHLCYKTMFLGKWVKYSSQFPVWVLRLVRDGRVRYTERGHGEGYQADGRLGYLKTPYLHFNFSKGLEDWLNRHNRYSTRDARACLDLLQRRSLDYRGLLSSDPVRRRRALKELATSLPGRPWVKFFYMYVLRGGFRDGRAGLTYCTLQAIYEYMVCLKMREFRLLRSGDSAPANQHSEEGAVVELPCKETFR